ncbi:hypothetical protein FZEAL_10865, partial [Fusarium zealandicum]
METSVDTVGERPTAKDSKTLDPLDDAQDRPESRICGYDWLNAPGYRLEKGKDQRSVR